MAQREPPEYGVATALSMAVLLIMLPAIVFQQWYSGRRSFTTVGRKFAARDAAASMAMAAVRLVAAMIGLMTVVPVVWSLGTFMTLFGYFNVAEPWTLKNWQVALSNPTFINATLNTLIIATGKALLAMPVFTVIAYIVVRTRTEAAGCWTCSYGCPQRCLGSF